MGSDSECDFETSYDYGTGPDDDHVPGAKTTQLLLHGRTYILLEPAQTDEEAFEDLVELRDEHMAREELAFQDFIERRDERSAREAREFERFVERRNRNAEKIYARGLDEKRVEQDPNMSAHGPAADQVPGVQPCITCSAPVTTAVLIAGRPVLCEGCRNVQKKGQK